MQNIVKKGKWQVKRKEIESNLMIDRMYNLVYVFKVEKIFLTKCQMSPIMHYYYLKLKASNNRVRFLKIAKIAFFKRLENPFQNHTPANVWWKITISKRESWQNLHELSAVKLNPHLVHEIRSQIFDSYKKKYKVLE